MARILLVHGAWNAPWYGTGWSSGCAAGPDLAPRRGTLGAVARLAGRHPAEDDRPARDSRAVKPELDQEVWGRTQAEIYPGMGQDLMLDHGWTQVSDWVDT